LPIGQIQGEIVNLDDCPSGSLRGTVASPQQCPDTREQLAFEKRFENIVVRANI